MESLVQPSSCSAESYSRSACAMRSEGCGASGCSRTRGGHDGGDLSGVRPGRVGIDLLRERIARHYRDTYRCAVDAGRIVVTTG